MPRARWCSARDVVFTEPGRHEGHRRLHPLDPHVRAPLAAPVTSSPLARALRARVHTLVECARARSDACILVPADVFTIQPHQAMLAPMRRSEIIAAHAGFTGCLASFGHATHSPLPPLAHPSTPPLCGHHAVLGRFGRVSYLTQGAGCARRARLGPLATGRQPRGGSTRSFLRGRHGKEGEGGVEVGALPRFIRLVVSQIQHPGHARVLAAALFPPTRGK